MNATMTQTATISRRLANFAASLRFSDLPPEVVTQARRFLYDSIACAFGGFHTRDVRIVWEIYREMGGRPEATVIGYADRLPAVHVALINSLMVRALDFNDIYWKEDPSHPSDLIPAALAVGELVEASMEHVLTAIVLGYEFEQRLCEFAVPGIRERGWHHATLTQFASPLVAGKLLGLSVDELVNAVGINGCHNHTIGCPTAGKLTMMKNTVDPMAVQSGVFAALMARKGFTGTEAVFEGKEGWMEVFGPDWDLEKLVEDLGNRFKILECSMKAFPTEALTHTHITAALKLVTEHDIAHDQIEEVEVTTLARACDILFDPEKYRPTSRETADHSLPYCIAAALVDRQITVQSFSEEKLADRRIRRLMGRIKGRASEEFERLFPEKQPSRVTIRTRDGKEFSEYLEYPKGDPREPMTMQDLDAKFAALSVGLISDDKRRQIKDLIFDGHRLGARDFMAALEVV